MDRRSALALIAAAILGIGALLGLTPVGDDCGSAFSPDYSQSQINDTFAGLSGYETDCRDAVSNRRPPAYMGVGLGLAVLVLAVALPATPRRKSGV
jgi:hypothetical protein